MDKQEDLHARLTKVDSQSVAGSRSGHVHPSCAPDRLFYLSKTEE